MHDVIGQVNTTTILRTTATESLPLCCAFDCSCSVDEYWHVPHFEKMMYGEQLVINWQYMQYISTEEGHTPNYGNRTHYSMTSFQPEPANAARCNTCGALLGCFTRCAGAIYDLCTLAAKASSAGRTSDMPSSNLCHACTDCAYRGSNEEDALILLPKLGLMLHLFCLRGT
jgi:hypothetical protein